MTSTLRTLLQELDRPDLDDSAKQVVQVEIEKFLGRNARKILAVMTVYEGLTASALTVTGEYRPEAHCRKCGIKIPGTELGYCSECQRSEIKDWIPTEGEVSNFWLDQWWQENDACS